jgi:hypothetical protein
MLFALQLAQEHVGIRRGPFLEWLRESRTRGASPQALIWSLLTICVILISTLNFMLQTVESVYRNGKDAMDGVEVREAPTAPLDRLFAPGPRRSSFASPTLR